MKPAIAIPATAALVYRAYSRKSLTPLGIVTAFITAVIHAAHPSPTPFLLLCVFFLGGTAATKIKHDVKARLTLSAAGASGGEGARTHVQVLANSGVASVLILVHLWKLYIGTGEAREYCWPDRIDPLMGGIVANYAAVAADTFSSELGILSRSPPRLITSLSLRTVPPGTNGGVSLAGILSGAFGAFTIAVTTAMSIDFCPGSGSQIQRWRPELWLKLIFTTTIWGTLGSLLDSFLGGWLQASVVDKRSGKIVEGTGGKKVLVTPYSITSKRAADIKKAAMDGGSLDRDLKAQPTTPQQTKEEEKHLESRKVENGRDLLDNNGVNILMALIMSLGAVAIDGSF